MRKQEEFMMKRLVLIVVPLVALGLLAMTASAGDHKDAPSVGGDPAADIADVYAFRSPENSGNLVVALNVNGLEAPAETAERNFATDVSYEIHVDNTGDLVADATARVTFSGEPLMLTIEGLGDPITGEVTPPGSAEAKVTEVNGIKVFAGPRDDPLFQDIQFFAFLAAPYVPANGLRRAGETPADFLAGFNLSSIVIELPITTLTGGASSNTGTIKAWATTKRGGSQVDRMAIPDIMNFLIPQDQKDAFNRAEPANDEANYRPTAQTTIEGLRSAVDTAFGSPQDGGPLGDLTAEQAATALIPDLVTIDFSQPVQFPNGRRLQDDVGDVGLGILLNRGGAAGISDAIDANDVAFGTGFPFLAAPHAQAAQAEPTATAGAPTASAVAPTALPPAGAGDISSDSEGGALPWIILAAAAALGAALLGGGLYTRRARS